MDYGFSVPTRGPLANRADLLALARRGEALGFAYLAVPDHLVVPKEIGSRYPYSQGGDWPGRASGECLEQLTLMTWLAAATTRVRLLSSVMVVPHRNPVHTAKILATLDVLSGGRAVLGVGTGWLREEFEAVGTEPFDERGAVTDEYIRVFKRLWSEPEPAFAGDYVNFRDIYFEPKPVQQPLPVWIGGESGRALRRVVELGDGWYPIGANPRDPLNTVARYGGALGRLRAMAEKAGRDPATIALAFWANWVGDQAPIAVEAGQRFIMTGSNEQVAQDIDGLAGLGVRHVLFNFQRPGLAETLEAMQRFAEQVQPLVSG
jgi:probable F420-dependent oxidoreductase